jgi:hypothetical protein
MKAQLEARTLPELKAFLGVVSSAQYQRGLVQAHVVEVTPEMAAAIEAREQEKTKLAFVHICRTFIGGRSPRMCEANYNVISEWLHPGEFLSVAWFKKVLSEQPELANSLAWEPFVSREERKKAAASQLEIDRQTFAKAARMLHIGENEANFGLIRSMLGEGFSIYQVQQAIASGAIGLSAATEEDIEKWRVEAETERQDFLVNRATPAELHQAVRSESEQRRTTTQQSEADEAFAAAQARDAARGGFPPLPPEITSEVIRKATPDQIKFWIKKHSNSNVTARLQGRG